MAVKRYRYPITSHMVLQSRHDILVRTAENKADSGGSRPRDKRSILGDSGTIVEKALQGEVELHRGKRDGGGSVDVRIEDIGEEASVPAARIDAAMHVRLTVGAARDAAVECGLDALLRMLDCEGGARRLGGMLDDRHAHVHSLSHSIPDDVAACLTTDAVLVAIFDGRPADIVALRLVEGSHMDMAGRVGDAAAAYEDALRRCLAHIKKEAESVWAHLCAGHSLAHLGRAGEAEAMLREAARLDPANPLAYLELGHLASQPNSGR